MTACALAKLASTIRSSAQHDRPSAWVKIPISLPSKKDSAPAERRIRLRAQLPGVFHPHHGGAMFRFKRRQLEVSPTSDTDGFAPCQKAFRKTSARAFLHHELVVLFGAATRFKSDEQSRKLGPRFLHKRRQHSIQRRVEPEQRRRNAKEAQRAFFEIGLDWYAANCCPKDFSIAADYRLRETEMEPD